MSKIFEILYKPNILDENDVTTLRNTISHLDVSRNLLTDEGLNAIKD